MRKTDYENKYKNAKKFDKAGSVYIIVRFGEVYLPVKAKPIPLPEQCETRSEILRLNLTMWALNDIPEVKKVTGVVCSNHEALLYWNGAERSWKFYDEPFSSLEDDLTDHQWAKVEDLRKRYEADGYFFEPHIDEDGNLGDEEDHAVYDHKTLKKFADSGDKPSPRTDLKFHESTFIEVAAMNASMQVYIARCKHKKIPYATEGKLFRKLLAGKTDEEIGKALAGMSIT